MATNFSDKEVKRAKELYGIDLTEETLTLSQRMYVEDKIAESDRVFHSRKELHDFKNKVIEEMNINK